MLVRAVVVRHVFIHRINGLLARVLLSRNLTNDALLVGKFLTLHAVIPLYDFDTDIGLPLVVLAQHVFVDLVVILHLHPKLIDGCWLHHSLVPEVDSKVDVVHHFLLLLFALACLRLPSFDQGDKVVFRPRSPTAPRGASSFEI